MEVAENQPSGIDSAVGESEDISMQPARQHTLADDAVGMQKWYVAVVRPNTEIRSAEYLEKWGNECYVPQQTVETITPTGRRRKVNKVILPARLFVRCTEKARREIVKFPFIARFLVNKCANKVNGLNPLATIPDTEMDAFRRLLENRGQDVEIFECDLVKGDMVEVVTPGMKGIQGVIEVTPDNKSYLFVRLGTFACARVKVKRSEVRKIKK